MMDISSLIKGAPQAPGSNAPSGQMPQPDMQGGNNPLSALVKQSAPPPKKLTHDHVVAAMHYFDAAIRALKPLTQNDLFGRGNIRPKIFDAVALLLGERILTIADAMNWIKTLPDDPAGQKKWVEDQLRQNEMAKAKVLDDYRNTDNDWMAEAEGSKYGTDNHQDHVKGLMDRYNA